MVRIVIVAMLSGILGGSLMYFSLATAVSARVPGVGYLFEKSRLPPVVIQQRDTVVLRQEEALADALKIFDRSLADVVSRPISAKSQISNLKFSAPNPYTLNPLASALAVTDDGWFVAPTTTLAAPNKLSLRDRDGRLYPVIDRVIDPYLGVTFLHIASNDGFKAAQFPRAPIEFGSFVVAVRTTEQGEREVFPTYVTALRVQGLGVRVQGESSERMTRLLGLRDTIPARFDSQFVIRLDGVVAGVVRSGGLVSGNLLAARTGLLARKGALANPRLGMTYENYAQLVVSGVTAGDVAGTSGLRIGDIITAMDGVSLARDTVFAELLAAIAPDNGVTLKVTRGNESLEIMIPAR